MLEYPISRAWMDARVQSIYGGRPFEDEWTKGYIPHAKPYLLSSANSGPNTNGSQFFITTATTPWLNQRHVVFGAVESGQDVVDAIEKVGSDSGKPSQEVKIVDCGEVTAKTKKNN